jgi:transposase
MVPLVVCPNPSASSVWHRSERRLCERAHLNLAHRWFCRLGLEDCVPDHSSFSKNRHGRFRERGAFRHVFESVVQRCMAEGLAGGKGFAVDASVGQGRRQPRP